MIKYFGGGDGVLKGEDVYFGSQFKVQSVTVGKPEQQPKATGHTLYPQARKQITQALLGRRAYLALCLYRPFQP